MPGMDFSSFSCMSLMSILPCHCGLWSMSHRCPPYKPSVFPGGFHQGVHYHSFPVFLFLLPTASFCLIFSFSVSFVLSMCLRRCIYLFQWQSSLVPVSSGKKSTLLLYVSRIFRYLYFVLLFIFLTTFTLLHYLHFYTNVKMYSRQRGSCREGLVVCYNGIIIG